MTIRPHQPQDRDELARMYHSLFPHFTDDWDEIGRVGPGVSRTFFVADRSGGKLGGFVEVSLRNIADGCSSTPVGYVEAWHVDTDLRRTGLGSKLIEAAEAWARGQGCSEMASDCLVENDVSAKAHGALGFEEVDRCINYRKAIAPSRSVPDNSTWIDLSSGPLASLRAIEFVTDGTAGGIDVFLGTTRAEKSADGRELIALDYEAYSEMAIEQLRKLAQRAQEKWPIVKLALLHRVGQVGLGEPSVVIAVSTPHRAEAFDACRFLIEELKRDIAIWKKEIWADGSGTWVHPV